MARPERSFNKMTEVRSKSRRGSCAGPAPGAAHGGGTRKSTSSANKSSNVAGSGVARALASSAAAEALASAGASESEALKTRTTAPPPAQSGINRGNTSSFITSGSTYCFRKDRDANLGASSGSTSLSSKPVRAFSSSKSSDLLVTPSSAKTMRGAGTNSSSQGSVSASESTTSNQRSCSKEIESEFIASFPSTLCQQWKTTISSGSSTRKPLLASFAALNCEPWRPIISCNRRGNSTIGTSDQVSSMTPIGPCLPTRQHRASGLATTG
mmetsp:Transcript_21176/g.59127  ORF Transcript_21176/g.59127 Transcript_21176/m.59127 type:complete len:269 (-) Transcript_21176:590-1396(-)